MILYSTISYYIITVKLQERCLLIDFKVQAGSVVISFQQGPPNPPGPYEPSKSFFSAIINNNLLY